MRTYGFSKLNSQEKTLCYQSMAKQSRVDEQLKSMNVLGTQPSNRKKLFSKNFSLLFYFYFISKATSFANISPASLSLNVSSMNNDGANQLHTIIEEQSK